MSFFLILLNLFFTLFFTGCSTKKYNLSESFPIFPAAKNEIEISEKKNILIGNDYEASEFDNAIKNSGKFKKVIFQKDNQIVTKHSINGKKRQAEVLSANTCGGLLYVFFKNGYMEIHRNNALEKEIKLSESVEDSLCNNGVLFFLTGDKLYSSHKLNNTLMLDSTAESVLFKTKYDRKKIQKVDQYLIFPFSNGNIEVFDLARLDVVDRYSADFGKYNPSNHLLFNPKIINNNIIIFGTSQYGLFAFELKSHRLLWNLDYIRLQSEVEAFDRYLFMIANKKLLAVDLYTGNILNSVDLDKNIKTGKIIQIDYEKLAIISEKNINFFNKNLEKTKTISISGKQVIKALN